MTNTAFNLEAHIGDKQAQTARLAIVTAAKLLEGTSPDRLFEVRPQLAALSDMAMANHWAAEMARRRAALLDQITADLDAMEDDPRF